MAEPMAMPIAGRTDVDLFLGADTAASGPVRFEGVSACNFGPGFLTFIDAGGLEHTWAGMFVAHLRPHHKPAAPRPAIITGGLE